MKGKDKKMKGKKKRRPTAHRLIAFVLAFAMIFTSISFSDFGSVGAKAAAGTQDDPYVYEMTGDNVTGSTLFSYLKNDIGLDVGYIGINIGGIDVTYLSKNTSFSANTYEVKKKTKGYPVTYEHLCYLKVEKQTQAKVALNQYKEGKTYFDVDYNFFYSVNNENQNFVKNVFNVAVDTNSSLAGLSSADVKLQIYISSTDSWIDYDSVGGLLAFEFKKDGNTDTYRFTYNSTPSDSFVIKLNESREMLTIDGTGAEVIYADATSGAAAIKKSALDEAALPSDAELESEPTYTLPILTHLAYTNVDVAISVKESASYLASSGTITVPVKLKEEPSTLTVKENVDKGDVTIIDSAGNTVTNSSKDTMTVEVDPVDGYYVDSVNIYEVTTTNGETTRVQLSQTDATYANAVYTAKFSIESNTAYEIEVVYAEWTLTIPENMEIAVNGYTGTTGVDYSYRTKDLKNKILTEALGSEVVTAEEFDETKYSVKMYINAKVFNIDLSGYYDIDSIYIGAALDVANGEVEKILITYTDGSEKYPEANAYSTVTFTDSRKELTIELKNSNEFSFDEMPESYSDWYTVTDSEGNVITEGISESLNPAKLPAEGVKAEYALTVNVTGTADYLETTKDLTVYITNPQYDPIIKYKDVTDEDDNVLATIEVKDSSGKTIESGKEVPVGEYTVVVTPKVEGAYVSALSGATPETESWNNTVYTATFNTEYGTTENTEYEVSARVLIREISINEGKTVVYTTDEDKLLKAVFNTVVDNSAPDSIQYGDEDVAIALKEGTTLTKNAWNTYVITWAVSDDGKFPEISVEAKVYISEKRVKADIDTTDVSLVGEGILMITADETNADGTLTAEAKTAILNAVTGIKVSSDAAEPVLSVKEWSGAPTQAGKETVTVTVSVAENDRYLANNTTFDITIFGDVNDANVTVTEPVSGTVTISPVSGIVAADVTESYKAGKYYVTLTPDEGYFIDKLEVTLDGKTTTYTYDQFDENGQVVIDIINGSGKALDYVPAYTLTATFVKPEIKINDATVNYYGQDASLLPAQIWKDVKPSTTPVNLTENAKIDTDPTVTVQETNDLTVYYLAREAATYKETITVNLPIVGNQTFTIDVPVTDQWLEISQTVPTGAGMPTQDDIKEIVNELLEKYSFTELLSMGTDELKALVKSEMVGVYEEYYRFYNAHSFGKSEDGYETVKAVYNSERFGVVESNEAVITLDDTRAVSEIKLNEGVEMTYGFTEAELTEALLNGVYDTTTGEKIDGATISYITNVEGLNASETAYTVKVEYAGNETYKHSTAETTIIVNKAPVDVQVDNRLIKWEENLTYDMPVVTDPAGVDTIKFIVGLDVNDINIDNGEIKGVMGEVQLMIPDSLQSILAGVGIKDGVSMTVSELQDALMSAADALGFINSENETINTLITMLESLPTETADVTVKVGGELPTDIGVYLVGAVSADGNYETNFGVGAIVIIPDGKKADLGWIVEDDNNIITRTLLTNGIYDMGAKVVSVAEGSIEEAEQQIVEVFLGIDVDGNITIETDQTKLNVGAYTEVAMIVNWGNEMYYSEPIARAFVVAAESLDVTFIDETGAENAERLYTFDNTAKEMDVKVAYKNGGDEILNTVTGYVAEGHSIDNLKIYYVGAQTNVNPYLSTEPPVHAGAYTVTAVYTIRDAEGMVSHVGLNVGALVIEPTTSDIDVESQYYEYEKGVSHSTADMITATSAVEGITPDTTVITAGITTDGTFSENAWDAVVGKVNVDMPTWLDNVIKKLGILDAGYTETGITASTFLAYVEKIETALTELNISVDTISELKDTISQMPENAVLTFADDVAYSAVGAYLVVGVVTDSDHYPSVDAGMLVIYPDATEVELKFEEDWNDNNIFTLDYLQKFNMEASAYDIEGANAGQINEEADKLVTNIYLGVTDDGDIILTDAKADLDVGAYTQIAYLLDIDSTMYYAKPISRAFVVVPNVAEITFVDETGVENSDRQFVYDGKPHAMNAIVTVDGTVLEQIPDIWYVGIENDVVFYSSDVPPTDVGAYQVIGYYFNEEENIFSVGLGAMTITQREVTVVVDDKSMTVNGTVPELTYTVKNNATAAPLEVSVSTEADGTVVGEFPITATVVDNPNYIVKEVVNGTLTVTFNLVKNIDQIMDELKLEVIENGDLTDNIAYVRGFELGSSVESLIAKLEAIEGAELVSFTDGNLTGNPEITTGIVSTGMEFVLEVNGVQYTRIMVIMGDANGDGKIWATDYKLIKNQIMDEKQYLFDEYELAADIDDNGLIQATDYKAIKNHIMEIKEIVQTTKQWDN